MSQWRCINVLTDAPEPGYRVWNRADLDREIAETEQVNGEHRYRKGRYVTQQVEREITQHLREGVPMQEVAVMVGFSVSTIKLVARRHGIGRRRVAVG